MAIPGGDGTAGRSQRRLCRRRYNSEDTGRRTEAGWYTGRAAADRVSVPAVIHPAHREPIMGDFDLLCQATVPLGSYQEPDDFVVEYSGWIRHDGQPVGEFRLYKVLLGLAADYGENAFDVFDAHSQPLHDCYAALFDPETDHFKEEIDQQFGCIGSDLLLLDSLVLDRQWRGLRLGLLAVRKVINLLEGACGLVVCKPFPLEGAGKATGVRRSTQDWSIAKCPHGEE